MKAWGRVKRPRFGLETSPRIEVYRDRLPGFLFQPRSPEERVCFKGLAG